MAAQDDTKQIRTSKSSTTAAPPRAYPSDERARSLPPVFEPESTLEVAPAKPRDAVHITFLVGIICVLVGVIAMYIVKPAITNLVDSPRAIPTTEGP